MRAATAVEIFHTMARLFSLMNSIILIVVVKPFHVPVENLRVKIRKLGGCSTAEPNAKNSDTSTQPKTIS